MMQNFKGDQIEKKFFNSTNNFYQINDPQKNDFLSDAYNCFVLGDILFISRTSPLANAIPRQIFREAFAEIFESFIKVGTFEAYLTVFRKIFGETVDVQFTVPGPGQLNIDIIADGVNISDFLARSIIDDEYVFTELIDHEGNNLAFQTIRGFRTQYELEQMLFEMVPGGIFTQISLTLGA